MIAFRILLSGLLVLAFGIYTTIGAQGLVAYYSFDACDAADDSGQGSDGVISGAPDCVCGIEGSALQFDGVNDNIQFLGNFDILFSDDFTLSFYLKLDGLAGTVDIFSKKEACGSEKSVSIRFDGPTGRLVAEIAQDISSLVRTQVELPADNCWNHIAWVRNGNTLRLYLNGNQVDQRSTNQMLNISNNGVFSIANSPCLANGELRILGSLDEIRMYNRALSTGEIRDLINPFDQILNQDTVIFVGSSVQVNLPFSCAAQAIWSPGTGVNMQGDLEPLLSPTESTTYIVSLDYGNCTARDSLAIIVVDSSDLQCEEIFFPKAFTPNADGLNDIFSISNAAFLGDFISFEIYDRWGGEVFSAMSYDEGWDGTHKGAEVVPGMYVYKFRFSCNGDEKVKIGSFTLIR